MSEEKEVKKESWYPGKYVQKIVKRSSIAGRPNSVDSNERSSHSNEHQDEEYLREQSFINLPPDLVNLQSDAINSYPKLLPSNLTNLPPSPYQIRIRLIEVKYPRFKDIKLSVRLDSVKVSNITESQFPYECTLSVFNVTSDIKIEIQGTSTLSPAYNHGVVYIPVSSLLGFFGSVLPPVTMCKEIYPLYDKTRRGDALLSKKFFAALPNLPGSGLTKAKFPLGFVKMEVEFLAPSKNVLGVYLLPPPPAESNKLEVELLEVSEQQLQFQHSVGVRDCERLRALLLKPPALLSPFLVFPEVLIVIAVLGCVCFSVAESQLPLLFFFVVLGNGVKSYLNRSYSHVQIWNDLSSSPQGEDDAPLKTPLAPTGPLVSLLKLHSYLLTQLTHMVHEIEVAQNLLSFADPRASVIFYLAFLACSLLASLWSNLFSFRSFLFFFLSFLLLAFSCASLLAEQSASISKHSLYLPLFTFAQQVGRGVRTVWGKVPDEMEMQHRHIATVSIVKESSMVMIDAAAEYNKQESVW